MEVDKDDAIDDDDDDDFEERDLAAMQRTGVDGSFCKEGSSPRAEAKLSKKCFAIRNLLSHYHWRLSGRDVAFETMTASSESINNHVPVRVERPNMSEKGRRGRRPIAIHFVRGTLFTFNRRATDAPNQSFPPCSATPSSTKAAKTCPLRPSFHRHLKSASKIAVDRSPPSSPGLAPRPSDPGCLSNAEPFIKMAIKFLTVAPIYKKFYTEAYKIYVQLPMNVLTMIFGAALCFFGGTYVASIAAIEAFRQLGWQKVVTEVTVVREQLQIVYAASAEDDKVDEDGDGVADVDQLEATELAQRKIVVAMKAVTEPNRLQEAFGALFASYLAVLATLRLEFARTTAFALGIVEMAKFPIIRILGPMVAATLGEDLAHWTQTIVETTLTFFAVIFAWWLQMIISAFYSGIRGGKMFADGLIACSSRRTSWRRCR